MEGNVVKYLNGIASSLPTEIVSQKTYNKIYQTAALFSNFAASEYIMETYLNTESAKVDFSFRVLEAEKACLNFTKLSTDETWMRINDFVNYWSNNIDDIWFEMDYGEYDKQIPQPCFFFNASQIKKGKDIDYQLLFGALERLLGNEQLAALRGNIKDVIEQLPAEVGLFQVGTMLARNSDRVRVFTAELTKEQISEYLVNIGWPGSSTQLAEIFQLVHQYSDGQYIVDFDVTGMGVSDKIGINFGLNKKQTLPIFLDNLVKYQLCTDIKRNGVLAWSGSQGCFLGPDYGFTALIKNISHFKVSYLPAEGLKAKAYLRVAGIYLKELFKTKATTKENKLKLGYKELQNTIKEVALKSMLDKDYRELCLTDSKVAIQKVIGNEVAIPDDITFLEQDGEIFDGEGICYILPPFLKQSWLLSK